MSLKNKASAAAKKAEGKMQETIGNITGDPNAQLEGKAKQVEADIRHDTEVVNEEMEDATQDSSDRLGATAKNVEGKVQESFGNLTGNHEDQIKGKAKQVEANVRHAVQDVKDTFEKKD